MSSALTQDELLKLIRKGIYQPSTTTILDADILRSVDTAIDVIGQMLAAADPEYFKTIVSLQSSQNGNVFEMPSDLYRLLWVKDLGQNAGSVTAATNTSPIVITEADHPHVDGSVVTIHGVLGNTSANGTWKITYVDENSYSLDGSTGNDDYTSGGTAYEELTFYDIERMREKFSSGSGGWYQSGTKIIIDDTGFTNDILVAYSYRPTSLSDIPAEFHRIALESFAVVDNMEIPNSKDERYPKMKASYDRHADRWQLAMLQAKKWKKSAISHNLGKHYESQFI